MVQTAYTRAAARGPDLTFQADAAAPGPCLAVIGARDDLDRAAARLEAIPASAWLRGTILLVEAADTLPPCDSVLRLVDIPNGAELATAPSIAFYGAIVQHAVALGVLKGRDAVGHAVPRRATSQYRRGLMSVFLSLMSRPLTLRDKGGAGSGEWRSPFPMI